LGVGVGLLWDYCGKCCGREASDEEGLDERHY
jgi:hypothetical protein